MDKIGVEYLSAAIIKRTIEDYAIDEVEIHKELKKPNPDERFIKIKRDDQKQIEKDIRNNFDLYTKMEPEAVISICKEYARLRVEKD